MTAIGKLRATSPAYMPELSWGEIMQVWRKLSWLILLLGCCGAMVAYAVSFMITPVYEAESVILFDRAHSASLGNPADEVSTDAMQRASLVHSQMEILRSSDIIGTVIDRLQLAREPMFNPKPDLRQRAVGELARRLGLQSPTAANLPADAGAGLMAEYRDHLSVRQDEDTYVLRIDVSATSAKLAADIANAHTAAYLDWLRDRRSRAISGASNWLQDAVNAQHARVVTSEKAISNFNARGVLLDANGRTVLDQTLTQLTGDLAMGQANLMRLQARAEEIARLQASGRLEGIVAMSNSTVLSNLQADYAQANAQMAANQDSLGGRNPLLRESRARSADLRAALAVQVRHMVEGETSQASIARVTVANLAAAVDRVKQQVIAAEDSRAELDRLEGEAKTERDVYLSLLGKLRSFDGVQSLVRPDATVLSPAMVPTVPSVPRRSLMTMFGFILSSGLTAGIIGWRMNRRDAVRHTSDAASFAGVNCLGVMPQIDRLQINGMRGNSDPQYSFFREELRSLFTAVIRGWGKPGQSMSILITSPLPGDGKSTFCDELGRFGASNDVRTLIVRTDAKFGPLHDAPNQGEITQIHDDWPLFAVNWTPPMALHDDNALHRAVDAWKADYGLVIFDTPPLSAMAESVVLAPIADATLLLARINRTPRSLLANVAAQIERAGGRLAGLVVTFAQLDSQSGVVPSDFGYYFDKNLSYYRRLN